MFDQDYTFGETEVSCDGENCSRSETIDGFDRHPLLFSDVAQEIKKMGWVVKKEDGEWLHICPDCK